ncbi:MAG: caspase family protein [Bacteroidota bacterium]
MKFKLSWKTTIILVFSTSFSFAQTDYYTLGVQEYTNNNFDKAIKHFTSYVNSKANDNAKMVSSNLLTSLSYYALAKIDSAYSSILFMNNYKPNSEQKKMMYYYLAYYETINKNDDRAIDFLAQSIDAKDDENAYVYLLRADIYMRASKIDLAEKDWQKCSKLDNKGIYKAYASYYLGDYKLSLQSLFNYLIFNPNPNAYFNASNYFCLLGDYNSCIKYLKLSFDLGFRGKGFVIYNPEFLKLQSNVDFINLLKDYFPGQLIKISEVDTSYLVNFNKYRKANNIIAYTNNLFTLKYNICDFNYKSFSSCTDVEYGNKNDNVLYTYDYSTFYFEPTVIGLLSIEGCIAYNTFLSKAYDLALNPLSLNKIKKVYPIKLNKDKYLILNQSFIFTKETSETGTSVGGKYFYRNNYSFSQYDNLSKLLTIIDESEQNKIADIVKKNENIRNELFDYLLENESEIASVSKLLNTSFDQPVLMFKYNIAQQKEIEQIGLFLPKSEFETEKQFQERKIKFEEQKSIIIKKNDKLRQDALISLIQNSYSHITLSINKIGNYDAENQKLPLTINNKTEEVIIPLNEAKSFKENIQKAEVSGDKQLLADGSTYDIFNIKVTHPITGSIYNFGSQKTPLYINSVQNNVENGIPKLVATASLLQESSGNGVLYGDESGLIVIIIKNEGEGTARNIRLNLVGNDVKGLQYDKTQNISGIAPKQEQSVNFHLKTDRDVQTYKDLLFTFNISEENGFNPPPINYTFSTQAFKEPNLVYIESRIKEIAGNNNNIIENNENIEVSILIQNKGQGVSQNTQAVIKINDPNIVCTTPEKLNQDIGTLNPGASQSIKLSFAVNNEYKGNDVLPIDIILSEKYQSYGGISPLGLQMKKVLLAATNVKTAGNFEQVIPITEVSMSSDVDVNIPVGTQINDKTFVVIIANENYQKEAKVQFAANDGKVFKEYCEKTLGIPSKNIHFALDASFGNMKSEIKWISDVASAFTGQAKIIFYYAGHGMPNEADKSAYLLPVDGFSSDFETAIKLSDLYNRLNVNPSQSVTVFLDACFSGSARDNGMLANARGVKIIPKDDIIKGNMIVFSAATGEETAYPYKEKEHGLFTYFLLKKLQDSKGNVDYQTLSDYIIENVKQQSIVVNQKSQTPQVNTSVAIQNTWQAMKIK